MKTYRRNFEEPAYRHDPQRNAELDQEIFEAEQHALQSEMRWGSAIRESYGWARAALGPAVSRKKRVFFTDLERAAEADFLRGDYLMGNNGLHAGAYAAISHMTIEGRQLVRSGRHFDSVGVASVAVRALNYMAGAVNFATRGIATETDDYDKCLVAIEVQLACAAAQDAWSNSPPSSG